MHSLDAFSPAGPNLQASEAFCAAFGLEVCATAEVFCADSEGTDIFDARGIDRAQEWSCCGRTKPLEGHSDLARFLVNVLLTAG